MKSDTLELIIEKARKYCAYQERCAYDVKMKLINWQINKNDIEDIINTLKNEKFIDNERFAIAFATGKLRNNKWGKNKIYYALKQKQIADKTTQKALNLLDIDEYSNTLKAVIKSKKINDTDEFIRNNKLVKYAQQKGFEPELVWKIIDNR